MQIKEIETILKNITNSNEIEILKIIYFLFYGVKIDLVQDRGKLKQDLLEFAGWKIKPKDVKSSYLEDQSSDTLNKIFKMLDLTLINEEDNFQNILRLFEFFYNLNKESNNDNESVSSISTLKSTETNANHKRLEKQIKLKIQGLRLDKDSLISERDDASNNGKDPTKIIKQIKEIEKEICKLKYELIKMKTGINNLEGLDGASQLGSEEKVRDWQKRNQGEEKNKDEIKEKVSSKESALKDYDDLDAISTSTKYTMTSSQIKKIELDREKLSQQSEMMKKLIEDNQKLKELYQEKLSTQSEMKKLIEDNQKLKESDREKLAKQSEMMKKLIDDNQKLKELDRVKTSQQSETMKKLIHDNQKLKEDFEKLTVSSARAQPVVRYESPPRSVPSLSRNFDWGYQMCPSPTYYSTPSYSSSLSRGNSSSGQSASFFSRGNSSSGQSVSSLTGIGKVNTGRLNSAGFNTVDDLRSLSRSVGGSQAQFERAMEGMGVSKRYARTAFKDL